MKDLGLPTLSATPQYGQTLMQKARSLIPQVQAIQDFQIWLQLKASKFEEQAGTVSCTGKQFVIIRMRLMKSN